MDATGELGFYCMADLYSCGETERQKRHEGLFPWTKATILKKIKQGKFPAPCPIRIGRLNLWPKEVINNFIKEIEGELQNDEA